MFQPLSYNSEGKHLYYIRGVKGLLNSTVNFKNWYIRRVKICKSCTQLHASLLYQNHNVAQFCFPIRMLTIPYLGVTSNYGM